MQKKDAMIADLKHSLEEQRKFAKEQALRLEQMLKQLTERDTARDVEVKALRAEMTALHSKFDNKFLALQGQLPSQSEAKALPKHGKQNKHQQQAQHSNDDSGSSVPVSGLSGLASPTNANTQTKAAAKPSAKAHTNFKKSKETNEEKTAATDLLAASSTNPSEAALLAKLSKAYQTRVFKGSDTFSEAVTKRIRLSLDSCCLAVCGRYKHSPVSVGEVVLASGMLEELQKCLPEWPPKLQASSKKITAVMLAETLSDLGNSQPQI